MATILEKVISAYKDAIHFTENEEDANNPNVAMMGITPESEFSEEANQTIESDCQKAIDYAWSLESNELNTNNAERFGHDLWLTRNHHGAGFWDGDWSEEFGNEMTEYCHTINDQEAYDTAGLIYFL